jgi:large subunit ribosomal protein L10
MALTRKQKEEIFESVKDKLGKQQSVVFTDFTGLSVTKVSELKRELKNLGAEYKVVKKNILAKVIEDAGIENLDIKSFDGSVGVAFSYEDQVSPVKAVYDFSKQKDSKDFKILGGILEGRGIGVEEVVALAQLPSRDQLLANLLAQMNAPVSGFVNVLAGNIKNLVYALNAIKEQKS